MSSEMNDDSIFVVETVPPPAGEIDIYSAPTRLHAPPLPVMTAMLAARTRTGAEIHAALEDDALVVERVNPEEVRALQGLFPALFANEDDTSTARPLSHVASPALLQALEAPRGARGVAPWHLVVGFAVVSIGTLALSLFA